MEAIALVLFWIILVFVLLKLWAMEREIERLGKMVGSMESTYFHLLADWLFAGDDWDDDEDDFDGVQVAQGEEADE